MFRLIYSKFFVIKAFQASATVPHDFVRPLRLYSKLHIAIILLPILVLNIFGMFFTFEGFWDNQLQMTMFECIVMAPLLASFLFYEMYRSDPRSLLHKPTDESPFFVSMFVSPDGSTEADSDDAKRKKKKPRLTTKGKLTRNTTTDSGTAGKQLD